MVEIQGFCDERFQALGDLFRANQERAVDEGASLAVTLGGEFVVDLWAGSIDYRRAVPWSADTLVTVFSTGKAMVNLVALMLYDRGLLDLDAPIAEHWPEFAQNGKDAVTCRQVLTHTSGLPGFGCRVGSAELDDWDHVVGLLERAGLWYEPGTVSHYHAFTYGYLLGEVARRITGVPFGELFRREIAEPAGADFHFGLTDPADQARVARLWYPDPVEMPDAYEDPVMEEIETGDWVTPSKMAAVIPSAGGLGNGRSIARVAAILAMNGELDGHRYLSPETVAEAASEQSFLEDRVVGPLRIGLGFGLDSEYFLGPTRNSMHWGGYGGSLIGADPTLGLSVGFAPNRLLPEPDPEQLSGGAGRLITLISTIREIADDLGDSG
jgi:CubicO group peptidase (beta-lactamase class C family)